MSKRLYIRKFLNKPRTDYGVAAVLVDVTRETDGSVEGSVSISDCSRSISLSFYAGHKDTGEVANARYKLDALIDALTQTRKFIS